MLIPVLSIAILGSMSSIFIFLKTKVRKKVCIPFASVIFVVSADAMESYSVELLIYPLKLTCNLLGSKYKSVLFLLSKV